MLAIGNQTALSQAPSWYSGATFPALKRGVSAYFGGFNTFAEHCRETARKGYEGFIVS